MGNSNYGKVTYSGSSEATYKEVKIYNTSISRYLSVENGWVVCKYGPDKKQNAQIWRMYHYGGNDVVFRRGSSNNYISYRDSTGATYADGTKAVRFHVKTTNYNANTRIRSKYHAKDYLGYFSGREVVYVKPKFETLSAGNWQFHAP
eukprot:153772_1